MADPKDKDPAEGSEETIDRELARTAGEEQKHGSGKEPDQKGPAQPG